MTQKTSSDECRAVADLFLGSSRDSRCEGLGHHASLPASRRTSTEVMERMIYGSTTMEDLKNMRIEEADTRLVDTR